MFWQSRNDFLDEEIVFLPHTLIYCLMASCQTDNSSEKQRHHHVFWFSVCFKNWPVWIFGSHLLDLARCSASCFYVPSLPFLLHGQTRKYLSNSPSRQVVPLFWQGTCSKRICLSHCPLSLPFLVKLSIKTGCATILKLDLFQKNPVIQCKRNFV